MTLATTSSSHFEEAIDLCNRIAQTPTEDQVFINCLRDGPNQEGDSGLPADVLERLQTILSDRKILLESFRPTRLTEWRSAVRHLLFSQSRRKYCSKVISIIRMMSELTAFDVKALLDTQEIHMIRDPDDPDVHWPHIAVLLTERSDEILAFHCLRAVIRCPIEIIGPDPVLYRSSVRNNAAYDFLFSGSYKTRRDGSWFHQTLQMTWLAPHECTPAEQLDRIQRIASDITDFRAGIQFVYSIEEIIRADASLELRAIVEPRGILWAAQFKDHKNVERSWPVRLAAIKCLADIVERADKNAESGMAALQVLKLLSHRRQFLHRHVTNLLNDLRKRFQDRLSIAAASPIFSAKERLEELVISGWQKHREEYCTLRLEQLKGVDAVIRNAIEAKESILSCIDPTITEDIVELRPSLPRVYFCPINKYLIRDPCYCSDRTLYERSAIAPYLGKTSPITGKSNLYELPLPLALSAELEKYQNFYPEEIYPGETTHDDSEGSEEEVEADDRYKPLLRQLAHTGNLLSVFVNVMQSEIRNQNESDFQRNQLTELCDHLAQLESNVRTVETQLNAERF